MPPYPAFCTPATMTVNLHHTLDGANLASNFLTMCRMCGVPWFVAKPGTRILTENRGK